MHVYGKHENIFLKPVTPTATVVTLPVPSLEKGGGQFKLDRIIPFIDGQRGSM